MTLGGELDTLKPAPDWNVTLILFLWVIIAFKRWVFFVRETHHRQLLCSSRVGCGNIYAFMYVQTVRIALQSVLYGKKHDYRESEVPKVKLLVVSCDQVLYSLYTAHLSRLPSIAASSQQGMLLIIKPLAELPCNLGLFHSLLLTVTQTCSSYQAVKIDMQWTNFSPVFNFHSLPFSHSVNGENCAGGTKLT